MPYMRPIRGGYAECSRGDLSGAFEVSLSTALRWATLCQQAGHGQPRNASGYRLRPYPAMDVAAHAPFAPDGVYVDHRDANLAQHAYQMRDRLLRQANGDRQAMLATIAATFGLRHWRDAYNATRNVGRQITGENGRDHQTGELRWRAWSGRYSPAATARANASPYRAYGIEIEFYGPHGQHDASANGRISDALIAAGVDTHVRWSGWHRAAGVSGWHCTYDSTVAGEIISDIMDGSAASRDEVAQVLRLVRDHGGRAGVGQGMHVHHDVRDFTVDDRLRLVDNIAACQDAMLAFVGARRHSHWCRPMSASEFAGVRRAVANGGSGGNDHGVAWNFGHLTGRGSIEFRALGNTLNGRKVRAWIQAGQALLTATKAGHTFTRGISTADMLVVLQDHGMSRWAADVFATRCGVDLPVAA